MAPSFAMQGGLYNFFSLDFKIFDFLSELVRVGREPHILCHLLSKRGLCLFELIYEMRYCCSTQEKGEKRYLSV